MDQDIATRAEPRIEPLKAGENRIVQIDIKADETEALVSGEFIRRLWKPADHRHDLLRRRHPIHHSGDIRGGEIAGSALRLSRTIAMDVPLVKPSKGIKEKQTPVGKVGVHSGGKVPLKNAKLSHVTWHVARVDLSHEELQSRVPNEVLGL